MQSRTYSGVYLRLTVITTKLRDFQRDGRSGIAPKHRSTRARWKKESVVSGSLDTWTRIKKDDSVDEDEDCARKEDLELSPSGGSGPGARFPQQKRGGS